MRHEIGIAVAVALLACAVAPHAQDPQLAAPSLRAPLESLQDESGTFVLSLEIDQLAGETLASDDFTIVLGVDPAPADGLFSDSFESN